MELKEQEHAEKVKAYWETYLAGDTPLPSQLDGLHPEILDSWRHSLLHGLSPYADSKNALPRAQFQRILNRNRFYLSTAQEYMNNLYFYVKGTDFALALVDRDGYVLDLLIDDDLIKNQAHQSGLTIGCLRSEDAVGAACISMCLKLGKPYILQGAEHFIKWHHDYIGCAAPIYGQENILYGCLALIGPYGKMAPTHSLGMVTAAAAGIEKELSLRQAFDALSKTNEKLNLILNSLTSGILVIDRSGFIAHHNAKLLEFTDADYDLSGSHIRQLLQDDKLGKDILQTQESFENREISIGKSNLLLSVFCGPHDASDLILKFDKTESVHKLVNKIGGFTAKYSFSSIVGESPAMERVGQLGNIAAGNDYNLLILGESGTGKDILAQAIHNASSRADGPYIAINCAALPAGLIESELFGYAPGAFTGANRDGNPGKFELADGGTIFLDEIGDMPMEVQATLLRVIQNKEIIRIGSKTPKSIDVRIIAATNSDLPEAIREKTFRKDLFYRLNVLSIEMPPLRSRKSDIPLLIDHFLLRHGYSNKAVTCFTPRLYDRFQQYDWPGNVRELENMVQRFLIIAGSGEQDEEQIIAQLFNSHPAEQPSSAKAAIIDSLIPEPIIPDDREGSIKSPLKEYERIVHLLQKEHGHVATVAQRLNMPVRTLYRKIKKYNIDVTTYRTW